MKKIYNILAKDSPAKVVNRNEVLFLAIGGYNRTYSLLLEMGLEPEDIATFSSLDLKSGDFIAQTHGKEVLYINKINYLTDTKQFGDWYTRSLSLKVAYEFEESTLIYQKANRMFGAGKNRTQWIKPSIVILDDPSLGLQYEGYRFKFQTKLGFVQMANRNAEPRKILKEIETVEEADKLTFALYQTKNVNAEAVTKALDDLELMASRTVEESDYFKPTEFKRIVGSKDMVTHLKELEDLGIHQLKENKRLDAEVARWVIVPHDAYEFEGFKFKDEEDLYKEEIELEEAAERIFEEEQQKRLDDILSEEIYVNIKQGWIGNNLHSGGKVTIQSFIEDVDPIEEEIKGIQLLEDATEEEEYKAIKRNNLMYFLDGVYEDNERLDDNYTGGKKLISIDVDEGDYTRDEIEGKLDMQGLFGLVYPTAKRYFDNSARWRVVLLADEEMSKQTYKTTVEGVSDLLDLDVDDASKKLSQLMGYPFKKEDISIVIGTRVSVEQFKKEEPIFKPKSKNVISFNPNRTSNKRLIDFNHRQADLLRQALDGGIPEGHRNNDYFQIIKFLRDVQEDKQFEHWRQEAYELEEEIKTRMTMDGLNDKEIETICR